MAISIKHATTAVGTEAGDGEIGKTEWNEAHTLTLETGKLLGRTTAGAGAVEEVSLLDEDDMASDSATAVPTQQSVKAYVDAEVASASFTPTSGTVTVITASQTYTPPSGCVWVKFRIQGCGGTGSNGGSAASPVVTRGGASGSYAEKIIAASTISGGVYVTIAAASSGNDTTIASPVSITVPGASGTSRPSAVTGTVDLAIRGAEGGTGQSSENGGEAKGADSMLGFGGCGVGVTGTGYGSGGSSGKNSSSSANRPGASGAQAVVIVEEHYA